MLVDSDKHESDLKDLADKYQGSYLCQDFEAKKGYQDYEKLCNQITSQNEVSILVNAVEQFDVGKGKVHKTSDEDLLATLNMNTLPMVWMCRFLGP